MSQKLIDYTIRLITGAIIPTTTEKYVPVSFNLAKSSAAKQGHQDNLRYKRDGRVEHIGVMKIMFLQ